MKEKEPEQNICPHCHFDQSTYVMPPYVTPMSDLATLCEEMVGILRDSEK